MENYFEFVDTNREQFMALLKSNEFKCNAAGRRFMAERVKVSKSRPVTVDMDTLRYAEEIGGLKPGSEFKYPNAQGGTSKAVFLVRLPDEIKYGQTFLAVVQT